MRRHWLTVLIFVFCGTVFAGQINIAPKPGLMKPGNGFFILTEDTRILYEKGCDTEARKLKSYLEPATGYDIQSRPLMTATANTITLKINTKLASLGSEGYRLNVEKDRIDIASSTNAGIFYGIQTLHQLLPVEIFSDSIEEADWKVPCISIEDAPSYPWRGMRLDRQVYAQSHIAGPGDHE